MRDYGVTNVDAAQPVDGDTFFRIASTTKTFTGTVVMRLVEQGMLDLIAPVRRSWPNFRVADEAAAMRVTLGIEARRHDQSRLRVSCATYGASLGLVGGGNER